MKFRLKSDQNGIEIPIHPRALEILNALKSDQNGIEMGTSLYHYITKSNHGTVPMFWG